MSKIYTSADQLIGHTPLLELTHIEKDADLSAKLLAKLEEKGLIARIQRDGNKKWIYFKPTEKGLRANELHRSYDRVKTLEMLEALLKDSTIEEIESFYKITALRTLFLEKQRQNNSNSL